MELDGLSPGHEEDRDHRDHAFDTDGPWDTRRELDRSLSGDGAARDEFCRHYMDQVARWVRTHPQWPLLRRRQYEVDDLVGEIWAKVLKEDGWVRFSYRGKGSFEGWLMRVVDHAVKDLARRSGAQKRDPGDAACGLPAADMETGAVPLASSREPTPTSVARGEELLELARRVLTDDEFQAWHRWDYLGYSGAEVARFLGRSESGARGLVFRARSKLRELLEI